MTLKGKDEKFIRKGIGLRHASAHPDEIHTIDLSDHPHAGNPNAKVVIVEYACFQCPFCAHLATQMKTIKKRFKGKIVHYFKFYPVRSHPRGVAAALAGVAAHRQGKFWPMHDLMFENRADLSDSDLTVYAEKAGLDPGQFNQITKDKSTMRYVEKDKLEGMRIGVEGTPSFFINGKQYQGANDVSELIDRIEEEIEMAERGAN